MNTYSLGQTLVALKDICLSFGGNSILSHVNAEVRDVIRPGYTQGQVIGILGPSGIGKSQLSRIMAGLQEPTSGAVVVEGDKETHSGLVGLVPQNYPLLRHRTVLGNLVVAAKQAGCDNAEAKTRAFSYLEKFDLKDRASFYPSQLSGGQRQRIAIIQQLLCSDHFLIMDEPFTGLDPIMKDKTCTLINQVAQMDEKNTLFVVAHDIPALVSVSDTLWLLGRDHNEKGEPIPGAKIQAKYNLIDLDLAWHPELAETPRFYEFVAQVKSQFKSL